MSIPSQVTHNLKCPPELSSLLMFSSQFMHNSKCLPELPSLLIFPSQFMRNSKYPQVIAIPLDFLVSIHGQLAPSNVCRKILPSILIFWSQFMVHLHRVVLPDHYSRTVLSLLVCLVQVVFPQSSPWFVSSKASLLSLPLGLSRPRHLPSLGLSRPRCSPLLGLSRPSCTAIILQYSSPHTVSSK